MFNWLKGILKRTFDKIEQEHWNEVIKNGQRFELPGCDLCWGFETWEGNVFWIQQCLNHKNYWIRRQELEKEKDNEKS